MSERLGLSVVWSYVFAALLIVFIFVVLVPDADGPSPWDANAFQSALLELFANFRVLDELADLGIVRVADIGTGLLNVDLDLIAVSDRRFGWAPFGLAVVLGSMALLLRALRQKVLATHFGVPAAVRGQMSSYFFGRGLNLFFPFGPGDVGAAQFMTAAGAPEAAATRVVFHGRLFEVLAILFVLTGGLVYLGWGGAIVPAFWAIVLVTAVVSMTRPLGDAGTGLGRFNVIGHLWSAYNGRALARSAVTIFETPGFMLGVLLLSVVALGVEIVGYWCIKQAFSSPMDDYVLMKDLGFIPFIIVITVANMARVVPYTFASVGIYELVSVAMFRAFDQGYLSGATVSLLDSLLINGLSLIGFVIVLGLRHCPSAIDTWRAFFSQSVARCRLEVS